MLLSEIAKQHKLSTNDASILEQVLELECDLGIKVDIAPNGDAYSRASFRMKRRREYLGRVEHIAGFIAHFRDRWRAGSC